MKRLTAIALAGGNSSRMGQDKALLPIQGVPLLRRICEAALQCADRVYVVTSWGDRYQSILPAHCEIVAEQPLPGQSLPHGPLIGFAQGLAHIKANYFAETPLEFWRQGAEDHWVLLLACDMPRLQGEILKSWMSQLETVEVGAIALLPYHFQESTTKTWEPLCGFYRLSCLASLETFIQTGGRSFQRWLSQENVQELIVDDLEILMNCNTPEELRKLQD